MSKIIKLTSWNGEWLDTLLKDLDDHSKAEPQRQKLRQRLDGIYRLICEIAPDILCLIEGPAGEDGIDRFVSGLPGYRAVKRPPGDPYEQEGRQWIWFVAREELVERATLLPVQVWRDYTASASPNGEHQASWPVYHWGEILAKKHTHYRHPQVMILPLADTRLELIGGHFKSKLVKSGSFASSDEAERKTYIGQAVQARVKLASEAQNVRYYVDQRFAQEEAPAIFLMGDLNDGPGKELFERQFLFFDLLTALQGSIFEAEKYFNHALFDYPDPLRWSVHFQDKIDPGRSPHILLDHILFSQALVRDCLPLRVASQAGRIEHEIFDRINAQLSRSCKLSDHKPVSCLLTVND